ncbi:MAG: tripartite tricarboxylate transporter substrate binding protein, partial [Proteobacteria bacterium]|nr:tripartite tricarboxylate transporter substrate binding protein [Pseudomonadota bacterium]
SASAAYPDKPITVVVGWGPGGGIDTYVRTVGKHVKKHLGVEFKIIYKKGGGGKVAHNLLVKNYKADGYTIAAANIPHQSIPPQLSKKGYRLKDIQWIGTFALVPSTVIVRKDSAYKTFADLVKAAKAAPGKLKAGTPGATSGSAAFHYRWTEKAGARVALIPYRGGSKMLKALLGKETDIMSTNANWGVRYSDKLRVVAIASPKRYPLLPDTPTFKELGIDYIDNLSRSMTASAKVSKKKIKILSDAFGKLSKDPAFVADMKKIGLVAGYMNSKETTAYVDNYVKSSQKVFALMRDKQKKKKK